MSFQSFQPFSIEKMFYCYKTANKLFLVPYEPLERWSLPLHTMTSVFEIQYGEYGVPMYSWHKKDGDEYLIEIVFSK